MEEAEDMGEHQVDDGQLVVPGAARDGSDGGSPGMPRTGLLASMYQSQYSLQKKRYKVAVASLKR